jgi:hypothetical protein
MSFLLSVSLDFGEKKLAGVFQGKNIDKMKLA